MRTCVVLRAMTHQTIFTVIVSKMQLEERDCTLYDAVSDEFKLRGLGFAGFLKFL